VPRMRALAEMAINDFPERLASALGNLDNRKPTLRDIHYFFLPPLP